MRDIIQILRLNQEDRSIREIARIVNVSRTTVGETVRRANLGAPTEFGKSSTLRIFPDRPTIFSGRSQRPSATPSPAKVPPCRPRLNHGLASATTGKGHFNVGAAADIRPHRCGRQPQA